jgi:hypothetical protein
MTPSAASNPPPLSEENLRELQAAKQALGKIRRAALAARFEGYTVAICGGLTFLSGIGNVADMLGGAVLTAIGVIEIIGGGRLGRLDTKAVRIITVNQLCLAALILLYALWNLHAEVAHPASDLPDLSPADAQVLGQVDSSAMGLTHEIMLLLYGSLIAAAAAEAGMAAYYYSRGPYLQRYLAETPPWIISMQKSGISI